MENMLALFPKRNVFDLSHEVKLSCTMGNLIPILCKEVVPGDTFKIKTDMLIRLTPMLAPLMHRLNAFVHYFFVPTRLIWSDWEKFITGGTDGKDATVSPYFDVSSVTAGSICDYFGIPLTNSTIRISALPIRAYGLIYNEWYRDQNLQDKLPILLTSGHDTGTDVGVMPRNWEKDYFTSCLPWAQRGDPVTISLGTSAPVTVTETARNLEVWSTAPDSRKSKTVNSSDNVILDNTATHDGFLEARQTEREIEGTADLSEAEAISINELRQAFQVQKWMERNARAGVRYVESILSHFGVRSSDARLQRPEFLGGTKKPFTISEVLQTSSTGITGSATALGTMAGHAYSATNGKYIKKSFEEHGYIIGIMSIMPRTAYQQGLPRMWRRDTRFDYYWPEFAHLGEQPVYNRELYYANDGENDDVFGYQGRYDEYRRAESTVHGAFRTSLNFWHMGRIFDSRPDLNSAFVTCTPATRPFAVTTGDTCWVQILHDIKAIRPIPKTGEPGLIDHN